MNTGKNRAVYRSARNYGLIAILILSCLCENVYAGNVYATGPIMEIDRCASAWLIKRYVDPEATFEFYPDGALIKNGIAFDTPEAKWRRTHRHSTFETILHHKDLHGEKLEQLAAIIHDIEINAWEKRKEYKKILHEISEITARENSNHQRLKGCFDYFDNFKIK